MADGGTKSCLEGIKQSKLYKRTQLPANHRGSFRFQEGWTAKWACWRIPTFGIEHIPTWKRIALVAHLQRRRWGCRAGISCTSLDQGEIWLDAVKTIDFVYNPKKACCFTANVFFGRITVEYGQSLRLRFQCCARNSITPSKTKHWYDSKYPRFPGYSWRSLASRTTEVAIEIRSRANLHIVPKSQRAEPSTSNTSGGKGKNRKALTRIWYYTGREARGGQKIPNTFSHFKPR